MIKKKYLIKKLEMCFQVSPVFFENNKVKISSKNQFELLAYSQNFNVHNTLILDLTEEEDQLILDMSKYHRKNINKTSKIKNLKFEVLNKKKAGTVLLKSLMSLKSIIEFLLVKLQGQKKLGILC